MADLKADLLARFARFYRPTGKGHATRYPNLGTIGAVFDAKGRMSGIDTSMVAAITHEEIDRYLREYNRQENEGALERVDVDAYLASIAPAAVPAAEQPTEPDKPAKPSKK